VIRDSASGAIVYLPPEAKDVPSLMTELVAWVKAAEGEGLPIPLVASLAHYQFVTIHPYFDGNGRTARLLATFLLHRGGYGLQGLFSLEEYHARDLAKYYESLATHPHHNYYQGRETVGLTPWLEYFVETLARVFSVAEEQASEAAKGGVAGEPDLLKGLDFRARAVLGLFGRRDRITTRDVASVLGLSERMARNLVGEWVRQGWLKMADSSRRARAFELSAIYRQFIGNP
jgi:Fic family protein